MRVPGKRISNVINYFNEAAYKRWLRQYQINLAKYMDQLNGLRLRVDDLPECDEIGVAIDAVDVHLDKVMPRNFSEGFKPLEDSERFFENCKVFTGFIFGLFKSHNPFLSIYELEKKRVLKEHTLFKFKEKSFELKAMIELEEAKQQ